LGEISVGESPNVYFFDVSLNKGKYFVFSDIKNSTYVKSFLIE
jgi:hypothetical protein